MALRLQDSLGFTVEESIARGGAALMAKALAMIMVQARDSRPSEGHSIAGGRSDRSGHCYADLHLRDYAFCDFRYVILLGIGLGLMLTSNLASQS
jgi:DHA1 family tetracycline resistance protein-like MFS transporter